MDFTQSTDRKQRYKMLIDKNNELQNRIGQQLPSVTCVAVCDIVQTCDAIHNEGRMCEKLENPSEVVMDAQIIKSAHESVSKLLLANSEFNDISYQNAITALVSQNDADNWQVITEIVISVAKCAFTKSSMLGAIDVEPKERIVKERQQRRRAVLAAEKRPETIKQLKRDDRGHEKINIILKQVSDLFLTNNREPIPYFKLIIDPDNFMNTVENAFQMAFLARDGNIAIERGSDGYPQVRLATPDEIDSHQDTSQSICSLDMNKCQNMIEFYNITGPLLNVPADLDDADSTQITPDDEEEESI